MPRRPSSSGFSLSIDDDFDESRSYRVKLWELTEGQAKYPGAKPGEISLTWKMNIYRDDGTAFEDPRTGEVFDAWAFSSDSTFGTSRGRAYTNAFMGRDMTDDEIDELIDSGFAEGLVGKTARASFEIKKTDEGDEKLKLLLLRPDKPSRAAVVTPAPVAEPEPEPVAATSAPPVRRTPRRIDE